MTKYFKELIKKKADTCGVETMVHFLYANGLRHPDKPAYEWYDADADKICHVTYGELMANVASLGSVLYSRGFKGRRAALIGRTGYPWVLCFLASICSDIIVVPLDPTIGEEEMEKRLRHCKADAMFVADDLSFYADAFDKALKSRTSGTAACEDSVSDAPGQGSEIGAGAERSTLVRDADAFGLDSETGAVPEGDAQAIDEDASGQDCRIIRFSDLPGLLAQGESLLTDGYADWVDDYISEKQPAFMIFTSGTGGKMKAAVIRQENPTLERFVWAGIEADKSKCHLTLPLYHIAGIGDLRGTILVGTTAYLGGGLRYLLKEYAYVKPVTGFMVPAQAELVRGLLQGKSVEEGRKLLGGRFVAIRSSGAPLPGVMRDFFRSYDIDITSDYGMTETCGPVSVSVMKDGRLFSKPGSVGRILDCIEVKIADPNELGHGEVLISGQCVFDGYFEDPEETAKVLKDGWLHTGDIGYVDEDRYLYIVGRKKNVIVTRSGENVIPEEMEDAIRRIPGVKECLVHEKDGKLAVKIYAGAPGEDQKPDLDGEALRESIQEKIGMMNKGNPTYKRILSVEFTDAPLPKTATGKLIRDTGNA